MITPVTVLTVLACLQTLAIVFLIYSLYRITGNFLNYRAESKEILDGYQKIIEDTQKIMQKNDQIIAYFHEYYLYVSEQHEMGRPSCMNNQKNCVGHDDDLESPGSFL